MARRDTVSQYSTDTIGIEIYEQGAYVNADGNGGNAGVNTGSEDGGGEGAVTGNSLNTISAGNGGSGAGGYNSYSLRFAGINLIKHILFYLTIFAI